jgi:glutathione synthase/RimK-type ligase-like ATP-grasp enzyme
VGSSLLEEITVEDHMKLWAVEASKLFGGMDILTVDAIHTKEGKDVILEINDSASGFAPSNVKADMEHLRDLVIQRIEEHIQQK